jgi:hypothetical protein
MPGGLRKGIFNSRTKGTQNNPFISLAETQSYGVISGSYFFNLAGVGLFKGFVDNSEEGRWLLVAQYCNLATGASSITTVTSLPPENSAGTLGTQGEDTKLFRHVTNSFANLLDIQSVRWYGLNSIHSRILHFRSTTGINYIKTGIGSFSGIESDFTPLTGHSAFLPGSASTSSSNQGDNAMVAFAYFRPSPGYYWNIGGGYVPDMDSATPGNTLHRIYFQLP